MPNPAKHWDDWCQAFDARRGYFCCLERPHPGRQHETIYGDKFNVFPKREPEYVDSIGLLVLGGLSLKLSPAMSDTKPAIQCASMWGNLIAVLGSALPLISVELINFSPSRYVRMLALCITVIGAGLSSYGRVVDTKKISGLW